MSPRKTRRGAKADSTNETLSETLSSKPKENSPPPSQRAVRTRRQLSRTLAPDSEADQSTEINSSRRKTVRATPSGKGTRSKRRTTPADATILDDSSLVPEAAMSTKKRTRRAKYNEVSSEQTMPLDSPTANESRVEKSRGTRTRKRAKNVSKAETGSSVTVLTDTTETGIEPPLSREDTEVQLVSDRISRLRDSSIVASSSPRTNPKRRSRRTKLEDFTPESSPITISLSPHRSTKTPRKSPMNLGSPKSHADQSYGLPKTPRKLPVVVESPAGSERSNNSSIDGTPKRSPSRKGVTKTDERGSGEKNKKRTVKGKSANVTPVRSPSKDTSVRKFSKSPKIVLRTPKVKSPKSKSPRVVTGKANISSLTKRFSRSPTKKRKSRSPVHSSGSLEEPISPVVSTKRRTSRTPSRSSTGPDTHESEKTPSHDSPIVLSHVNGSLTSKEPRLLNVRNSPTVVLNKLSDADVAGTQDTSRRSSSRRSNADDKETPIATQSAEKRVSQGGESPRRAKSAVKRRTPISDSDTPLRALDSPRPGVGKNSIGKSAIVTLTKSTPIEGRSTRGKTGENGPILSSTPRDRIRRSLNLSPGLGATPAIAVNSPMNEQPVGSSTMIADTRATRSSMIEDVTNPLMSEDDESISLNSPTRNGQQTTVLDETFELAKKETVNVDTVEDEKAGDGTYELIEPKTPVLRRKAAKRSHAEIDTSAEERLTKRTCRVRFTCPTPNYETKPIARDVVKARSATPGQRITEKRGTPGNSVAMIRKLGNPRKRSNSASNVSLTKTPVSSVKRRSTSNSEASLISANKTAQNASVNRLSKPRLVIHQLNKKTDVKTPVAKKAPNFAQIHERKFAKMESLVDAKKRVEKRHLAINSQIPTSLAKVNTAIRTKPKVSPKVAAPSVPINGAYNRYGFKLRKNDAVKLVSQKQQPPHVSETKQNENRLLLKGVRTNRRFDLIMKARNIN